jgi:hypothetical protein
VKRYKRWGVGFLTERSATELLGARECLRSLSSHDVLTHDFAGAVKDPRVAKAVEIRKRVYSKLVWREMFCGTINRVAEFEAG